MNNVMKFIKEQVNDRLLNLHTSYIAKVIGVSDNTAKIQPLHRMKERGSLAEKYPVVEDVPIASYPIGDSQGKLNIKKGDTVLCLVCERSIDEGLNGEVYTPLTGKHHSINDSVIIAKIGGWQWKV